MAPHLEDHVDGFFEPPDLREVCDHGGHDLLGLLPVGVGEEGVRGGDVEVEGVPASRLRDGPLEERERGRRAVGAGEGGDSGDGLVGGDGGETVVEGFERPVAVFEGLGD